MSNKLDISDCKVAISYRSTLEYDGEPVESIEDLADSLIQEGNHEEAAYLLVTRNEFNGCLKLSLLSDPSKYVCYIFRREWFESDEGYKEIVFSEAPRDLEELIQKE